MKDIKELAEYIDLSNEAFALMTKNEKKVQIAKDCLSRIELGQLEPYKGAIVSYSSIQKLGKTNNNLTSLKDILNNDIRPCEVCAKGGLFMSYVGRTNDFRLCDFTSSDLEKYNSFSDSEHKKLLEIFTAKELAYIEFAFEGNQLLDKFKNGKPLYFSYLEHQRVKNFFETFGYPEARLVAICNNIIDNNGKFKLGKEFND